MQFREFGSTGVRLPLIGQGTWMMGESPARARSDLEALSLGIDLGMTHIDTAEMYGDGKAEALVAQAIAGKRDRVFLVSKVLPSNASKAGTMAACERSLRRLRTDYLDLYLLHWWSDRYPIAETISGLERLVAEGKSRFIGVSNLDAGHLEEARRASAETPLVCNQLCYHLRARGIEHDLIPYCADVGMAVVGYSPFGSGDFPRRGRRDWAVLETVSRRHGRTPHQVALNFLTRLAGLFTIPKAATAEHVRENAGAVGWQLTEEDIREINSVFRPPTSKLPLAMI